MAIYLHIHEKLALAIRSFDIQEYQEALSKLEVSKILIPHQAKVIESGTLPINNEYELNDQKIELWKYQSDFFFTFHHQNGLKLRFHPEIHLDYAYKNRSRQGFHLFYERIEIGPIKKIRLKFYNESKLYNSLTIQSLNELMNKIFDKNDPSFSLILDKDWLVESEFSDNFYLKSEFDLNILKHLNLTRSPKAKIILKDPCGSLHFKHNGEEFSLPFFKSNEVLLLFLRRKYNISTQHAFQLNINDPSAYCLIRPESIVEITRTHGMSNTVNTKKCKCGGMVRNNICSTIDCPFT